MAPTKPLLQKAPKIILKPSLNQSRGNGEHKKLADIIRLKRWLKSSAPNQNLITG